MRSHMVERERERWVGVASSLVRDHGMAAGAFVYQGSGKRHGADAERCQVRCASRARDLQWCMSRRGFDQTRCAGYLEAWQECTARCKAEEGEGPAPGGRGGARAAAAAGAANSNHSGER